MDNILKEVKGYKTTSKDEGMPTAQNFTLMLKMTNNGLMVAVMDKVDKVIFIVPISGIIDLYDELQERAKKAKEDSNET